MARISKQSLVYSVIQKLVLPTRQQSGKHVSTVGADCWVKMTTEPVGWKKHPGAKLCRCSVQKPTAASLLAGRGAQLRGWETLKSPIPYCPFPSAFWPGCSEAHPVLGKGLSQCAAEWRAKHTCTQSWCTKARLSALLYLSIKCWGAQALNGRLKVSL